MGGLVLDQVREGTRAYADWEEEGALRVLEREHQVNAYDKSIDSEQLLLIARRAPVAGDLRAIIAMSKCVAELERAGDEARRSPATCWPAPIRGPRRPATPVISGSWL